MKQAVIILFLTLVLLSVAIPGDLLAQGCAVCTKTAAGLGDKAARGLNGGIVYLALLPLSILGTLGFLWWRSNKNSI